MNPNTISWTQYQDIQISDKLLKENFDNFMKNGQYVEAIQLLSTNEEKLKGKAYISNTIQKIIEGIIDIQTVFDDGVNVFLSDLALQYDNMIESLTNTGDWNKLKWYRPYNFVIYQQNIYMAIDEPPIGTLPTNTQYWLKLGLQGIKGAAGTNVVMRYDWQSIRDYKPYDIVVYKNNLYVAIQNNINILPDSDESIWLPFLIVSKGGIVVSNISPTEKVQNTVWFKVEENPLLATTSLIGQFYRYTSQEEWEPMYPQTVFSWVEGREKFAPVIFVDSLTISSDMWKQTGDTYQFIYTNEKISDNSLIEIYLSNRVNPNQLSFYSSLEMVILDKKIQLNTNVIPETIPINIKIQ